MTKNAMSKMFLGALKVLPVMLLCFVAGWFIHKVVDLGKVPWQPIVLALAIMVIALVILALIARAMFRAALPHLAEEVNTAWGTVASTARNTPGSLTSPAFWCDTVFPAIQQSKGLVFSFLGAYGTMAAVVALAAVLCQTGTLAVAYLQIDRLDKQNEKLERQTQLLSSQNELLADQNLLAESARRAALLNIAGDVLARIEDTKGENEVPVLDTDLDIADNKDGRIKLRKAPGELLGRLAAVCSSLRGYRYLGDNGKPVENPRSPERGFVLRSLIASKIDIRPLIDQRADFTYAELEEADLTSSLLTPSGDTEKSWWQAAPGELGIKLAYSRMEGTNFSKSRLLGANLKGSWLVNADFRHASLLAVTFEHANVSGARFGLSDLRGSNFSGADLSAASFSETEGATYVTGALLPGAGAFQEADMTDVDLAGVFVNEESWLEEVSAASRAFVKSNWRQIKLESPAVNDGPSRARSSLGGYMWRIANVDGTYESNGSHGGMVITPRLDVHTPTPTPPRSE